MPKTESQLEAEIAKYENEYAKELAKEQQTKRVKELQKKLLRLKYRKQLAAADKARVSTRRGLISLGKSMSKGLRAVQKYSAHLEAQEKAAEKQRGKAKK